MGGLYFLIAVGLAASFCLHGKHEDGDVPLAWILHILLGIGGWVHFFWKIAEIQSLMGLGFLSSILFIVTVLVVRQGARLFLDWWSISPRASASMTVLMAFV